MKKFIAILILVYLTIIVLPMVAQAAPAHQPLQNRIQAPQKPDDKKLLRWSQGNQYRHVKYQPCFAKNCKYNGPGNQKNSLIFCKNKIKN